MAEKMKVISVTGIKEVQIIECDKPVPGPYEVVVKLKAVALCTAEQRAYLGIRNTGYPVIGGHEASGIVEAVGPNVFNCKVGDHVSGTFNYCGACEYCKRGQGTKCSSGRKGVRRVPIADGTVIGGGMAQYIIAPAVQICPHGEGISHKHASLTEPLGCCIHSVNKARIEFGDTVIIIGAGIMGLLHAKLCRMKGARVVVSEPDAVRRQKALDFGANIAIDPLAVDPVEYIKSITNGQGATVVVNTTSLSATWEQAIAMVAPYGRIMLYSSQHPDNPIGVKMGDMHTREFEMIGTVSPSADDFVQASRLMSYGLIDMEPVVDSCFPFSQAAEAFERACAPDSYRVIILHDE